MSLNYCLIVLSASLFFHGFFPVSTPILQTTNELPTYINNIPLNEKFLYQTNITKTVLVVIDALRLDFVNPKYMPITTKLMQNNGCFNKIKVETPTVTLPRIKALTAGNIPQFIDLVLNLANTEILLDSIIHSAQKENKKTVFYGDDTWLKLFPNKFSRSEGTNSFFVRDFKEVDDNVTRNVHVELENDDWDLMILHYLGLDHIGHVYGPFSSLIPTKLNEMDNIIHTIFEKTSSKNENILLMITGDHGMKDSGGHGGSTFSETNVPLVVIGHNCVNNSFSQVDIPVNLAVLLGLRIPSLAIGKVHKTLIQLDDKQYLYALYYNSILLKQKSSCCDNLLDEAVSYHINYLESTHSNSSRAVEAYERYLNVVSTKLARISVKQNLYCLCIAAFVMVNTLIMLFTDILFSLEKSRKFVMFKYIMIVIVFLQFVIEDNLIASSVMLVILNIMLFINFRFLILLKWNLSISFLHFFVFVGFVHPITFISSSYVEEEHQFWYFFSVLYIFLQSVTFSKVKNFSGILISFICLAIFRFIRGINSTGDKWAAYPDLSDWLLKDENYVWYQILFIFGLTLVFVAQYFLIENKRSTVVHFINFITLVLIFIFKQKGSSVILGKVIWFLILTQFIVTYTSSRAFTWTLILALLLKPYNVILIPYCVFSSLHFSKRFNRTETIVLFHTLFGNMLYFAQGHSNSLASVDISVGYIGLSDYQPILVIAQVLCHIQAFPVLCHLLTFTKCIERQKMWEVLFCNKLYIFFVTSIVTFIFRHHLFIWSVFAPKLFIEFVHVLFLFVEYLLVEGETFVKDHCKTKMWG